MKKQRKIIKLGKEIRKTGGRGRRCDFCRDLQMRELAMKARASRQSEQQLKGREAQRGDTGQVKEWGRLLAGT